MSLSPKQQSRKQRGLCTELWCTNKAAKGRSVCHKHHSRRYREQNPIRYLFNIKKQRAKERGIAWNWEFEEFRDFVTSTGYMENRGRLAGDLTLDRIDRKKGYESGNVQVLTNHQNVTKFWKNYRRDIGLEEIDFKSLSANNETLYAQDDCPY